MAKAKRLQADAKDRATFAEQMVGIVSHDLKNPLSAIQMGADMLGRGELPANQQKVLARIVRSTEHANRMIHELLDFTQARLGRGLPVALEVVDLHSSTSEAIQDLSMAYPGRLLHHRRVGEGACVVDSHRLAQLVGNLVSNSMTYGDAGAPVTVTVTSTIEEAEVSVSVHNHRTPIPADLQPVLFQPMTRGSTTTSAARSVGLGLYIVHEIVRAHGGRAQVESSSETGTTFTAIFPRAPL